MNFRQSAANYLRIVYYYHVLQIHRVDREAGSFSRTSSPITGDYTDLEISDYEPCCTFRGAQYLPNLLHSVASCH